MHPLTALLLTSLVALLATAIAVAARRRARAAERARTDDLRTLATLQARLENTEAILNAGPYAVFLWASKSIVKIFGGAPLQAPSDDDPYKEFYFLLDHASRGKLDTAMEALHDTGAGFAFRLNCRDGRTFAATGKPAGFNAALFISDVSEAFSEISALRGALGEAHYERQRLNSVIKAAPFPVWRRDEKNQLIWVNDAYCAAVDAPSAEAVLAQAENLIDADALTQAEKRGAAQRVRTVLRGERRVLDLYELAGSTGGFGMALDVTEADEANREMRHQINAQRITLNLLHTPIAIFTAGKHLEFFNQAFAELWELPAEWLAGGPEHGEVLEAMRETRRLPEQADFPAWKRIQLSHYTGLIDSQEELWHLPDARTLRVVTQPRPQGGLLVLYEDLTALLALERSFNALTRVQRESLNSLQEGVAVFGVDGRLGLYNPSLLRMWGLDDAALQNSPHIERLAELCAPRMTLQNAWEEIKARVTGVEAGRVISQTRMERDDGSVIDCVIAPLPDGGTMITFSDVSDTVQIEYALRERNDALETTDRLKSEFIAHISYQLRTPLNSIIGFGEILEQEFFGPLNKRQHEYTSGVLQASHHLLTLVNDVIDLAAIGAGRLDLTRAPVDVRGLLTAVCDLSRGRAREIDMKLKLECPPDAGVILADSRRLKQAMFNLLSNAFHFSNAGDEITIGASRLTTEDGTDICQLWVDDQGVGIDTNFQKNMFDPFKSQSRKGKEQGAGIGLSLVKSLIELHDGWVDVDSELGKGAKVTCNLPQASVKRAAISATA